MRNEDMRILDSLRGVEVLDNISEERLEEMFEEIKEYKRKRDAKRGRDISKIFSRKCSLVVKAEGNADNTHSGVEVSFNGCKGLPDIMLLGIAAMSSIAEHFPENKEEILSDICKMALLGEDVGIYKSEEELTKAEEEEE